MCLCGIRGHITRAVDHDRAIAGALSVYVCVIFARCFAFRDEVEGVVNPSRGNSDLLFRVAGKFELLDRVLPKFKASGHRVLMFFQMTQVMDIMEDFLRMKDLKYMRLDGSTKTEERTEMLNAFTSTTIEITCVIAIMALLVMDISVL